MAMEKARSATCRHRVSLAALISAAALVASCTTPIGKAPNLRGTYWENAIVTNPDDKGAQVVRWGPPQDYNPGSDR